MDALKSADSLRVVAGSISLMKQVDKIKKEFLRKAGASNPSLPIGRIDVASKQSLGAEWRSRSIMLTHKIFKEKLIMMSTLNATGISLETSLAEFEANQRYLRDGGNGLDAVILHRFDIFKEYDKVMAKWQVYKDLPCTPRAEMQWSILAYTLIGVFVCAVMCVACVVYRRYGGHKEKLKQEQAQVLQDADLLGDVLEDGHVFLLTEYCRLRGQPGARRAAYPELGTFNQVLNGGLMPNRGDRFRGINYHSLSTWFNKAMANYVKALVSEKDVRRWLVADDQVPHVVFFTDKKSTPPLLKTLSIEFKGPQKMGAERRPALVYVQDEASLSGETFDREFKKEALARFLSRCVGKHRSSHRSLRELTAAREAAGECAVSDGHFCLLMLGEQNLSALRSLAPKLWRDHVKVFYVKDAGFVAAFGAATGSVVLYRPKRKRFKLFSGDSGNVEELAEWVEAAIGGNLSANLRVTLRVVEHTHQFDARAENPRRRAGGVTGCFSLRNWPIFPMPLRTGGNGKECGFATVLQRSAPSPVLASLQDLRRPLNERNATGEVASEKSVVEKSALVRRTDRSDGEWDAYEKGHPAGAGCKRHLVTIRIGYPNKTINEIALVYHGKSDESKNFKVGFNAAVALMTNLTQKATVTGDSRAQRTPRVDPWQEVRAAQAEAEALEVELQSLAAESESLEAQLASAEAREAEAEQQLTSQSAAMLSECDIDEVKVAPRSDSKAHRSSFISYGSAAWRMATGRPHGGEWGSPFGRRRAGHAAHGTREAWVRFFGDTDVDGSGRITFHELETAIRKRLKTDISRYQLLVLWRQLDSDNSGEVSVEEVVQFLYRVDLSSWPEGKLQDVKRSVKRLHEAGAMWHQAAGNWYKIFLQIDFQSRGFITLDDLKRAVRGGFYGFRLSSQELPDEDLHQLWKAMDEEAEMRVPLRKFLAFMRRLGPPAPKRKLTKRRAPLKPKARMTPVFCGLYDSNDPAFLIIARPSMGAYMPPQKDLLSNHPARSER
eukprot:g11426.t1